MLVQAAAPLPNKETDVLDIAVFEIEELSQHISAVRRTSESRAKLVQWQHRIRGEFLGPLVQPDRYVDHQR